MRRRVMRKLFALVMTLALVMTSGLFVFAASSPTVGKVGTVSSVGNYSKKSYAVTWKAVSGADSYNVYVNGKLVKSGVTGTSYTVTGLKSNKNYSIQVSAVKNGKEGKKSDAVNKTLSKRWMKTTKIKKITSGKKKVTIKWKSVSGATGYQILQKKNGKWVVVKTVGKKTSTPIKKLKKGKYQFKVRPIKGNWLGIRSATKTGKAK